MDYRRILSDAGVSFFRSTLGVLSGIIIIPIVTRLMGEGAYGIWTTALAFASFTSLVSGAHLHGAMIRYAERENEGQAFTDILYLSGIISVAISLLVIFGFNYGLFGDLVSVPDGIHLPIALLVSGQIMSSILFNYPRSQQKVKTYELIRVVNQTIEIIVVAALFWITRDIVTALWGLATAIIILDMVILYIYRDIINRYPDIENFKVYLNYGLPMVPKEAAGSLLHHADKFLILFFLGPFSVGVYTVVYTVGKIFSSTAGALNSTLYPNIMQAWEQDEFEELREFYSASLRWYTILSIPAIAGLIILSGPILRLISTPDIARQGAFIIPILVIAFSIQGLENFLSYPLAAAERTKLIAWITGIAVVANVLLNLLLIPTRGLIGASLATTIAFSIRTILLYRYCTTYLELSLPIKELFYSFAGTAIMSSFLVVLPISSDIAKLVVYPIFGVVVYVFVLIGTGGIEKNEVETAIQAIKM